MGTIRRKPTRSRRSRPPRSTPPPEVFSAESADRAFVPEADVPGAGVDVNTGRRALAVRAGFMEALIVDPRIVRLFSGWIEQLHANPDDSDALSTEDLRPLVVDELGLRWPWCLVAIAETLHRMAQLKIGNPVEALPPIETAILAPPMVVGFEIQEGEATDEARVRWSELSAAVMAELDAAEAAVSGGRVPKGSAHLWARGRWFYEARVKQPAENIMTIAKRNHIDAGHPGCFQDHDCGEQVREAIDEAEQLLNLGEYFFRPGRGTPPP